MSPSKLVNQLFGAAVLLLLAAIAIHAGVGLLQSVWKQLVIIGVVAVVIGGLVAWLRLRFRDW